MRVEWRCASMTSGGQCVMTPGTALMLLWFASSQDTHILEVSQPHVYLPQIFLARGILITDKSSITDEYMQLLQHTAVLTLVLAVGKSSWTMFSVHQVLVDYQSVPAGQSCPTTASIPVMQVWVVKVSLFQMKKKNHNVFIGCFSFILNASLSWPLIIVIHIHSSSLCYWSAKTSGRDCCK